MLARRFGWLISAGITAAASAGVQESVTWIAEAGHGAAPGSPDNFKVSINFAGGYTLGKILFDGKLSPVIAGTLGNEAQVLVTAPDGLGIVLRLGSGGTYPPGTAFSGESFGLAGIDPVGTWTFEFFDTFNDGPGFDSLWDELTIELTDDFSGFPTGDPDVTLCQLYGLSQFGRVGGTLGLSVATTSWNVGTKNLDWHEEPDSRHPFIAMNMYRLSDDRFEQIGQSWLKHGYFALSNRQCGGVCDPTDGTELGTGCTDTYNASLNASQAGLGPRYEVNPWTGRWVWSGSVFDPSVGGPVNTAVTRRLQVNEADLLTAGAQYFVEAFYVQYQDDDVSNSAAWKPVTPNAPNPPSTTWSFTMTSANSQPNIGFALDAWPGAIQTLIAQEIPVQEFVSPDGRCILAAKAISLGGGEWRYEYALFNVDMDRQVGSFSIPISTAVTVSNVGFHAVAHHNEAVNTVDPDAVPIDNAPWTSEVTSTAVTWSTLSNPLRWGTLYNFWFTADQAPDSEFVEATVGLFRSGSPTSLNGATLGPLAPPASCEGDADGNLVVDVNDITFIIFRLGNSGTPGSVAGDVDGNGIVDVNDITFTVFRLGNPC